MNRLGLSMSHSRTLKIVRDLGEDHDKPVLEWKDLAEMQGAISCQHNLGSVSPLNNPVSSNDSDSIDSEENLTGESKDASEETTSSVTSEQPNGKEGTQRNPCYCLHIMS